MYRPSAYTFPPDLSSVIVERERFDLPDMLDSGHVI